MAQINERRDPHSASNSDSFSIKHLHLDWDVDFEQKAISGSVLLSIHPAKPAPPASKRLPTDSLVLDTKALSIKSVFFIAEGKKQECRFSIDSSINRFSDALCIQLPSGISDPFEVLIHYATTTSSTAIQWLEAEQTYGKKMPYLFTQCQAIHARSLVPCQDSSSVKFTYSATVRIAPQFRVLMSAIGVRSEHQFCLNKDGGETCQIVYHFFQQIPIPSYLLALVAGNLEGKPISQRCSIWSEPELLPECLKEFEDTENFIKIAERIAGPYVWSKYDLLILPPSFPYGGMENPCLTFVTPSLLAGDKSLVDVVAHEISHSWTGNLVTAANEEHFWLNEGFTMFVERKILAQIHGEYFRHFDSLLGLNELREDVDQFGPSNQLTCLVPDLTECHADDYFSRVPYEKGYNLLFTLESLVGADKFAAYLKAHLKHFAYKSITTNDWKAYLLEYFSNDSDAIAKLNRFDFDSWLYKPGFVPQVPAYDDGGISQHVRDVVKEIEATYLGTGKPNSQPVASIVEKITCLNTHQKIYLFDLLLELKQPINPEFFEVVDSVILPIKNVEILFRYFLVCLRSKYEPSYEKAGQFAIQHGRMKYCRRIYQALFECNPEMATRVFLANENFYHPIAVSMIRKDLKIDAKE